MESQIRRHFDEIIAPAKSLLNDIKIEEDLSLKRLSRSKIEEKKAKKKPANNPNEGVNKILLPLSRVKLTANKNLDWINKS